MTNAGSCTSGSSGTRGQIGRRLSVIPVLQGWRGGEVAEGESPRPHRRAREGGESRDGDGCAAATREPA